MKVRYAIDAKSGELVDRDGNSLGRVIALTLEMGGKGGKAVSSFDNRRTKEEAVAGDGGVGEEPKATPSQAVQQRIWDYWLEISGKRQKLDVKRKRIITNAVNLVGEDAVKRALLGLTRSPHHQGHNEQRRAYMEIRYALRGIGDESDDERIEKAITWAAQYAPDSQHMDPDKVTRYLEHIRYTMSLPHRPERERAANAYRALKAAGFTIVALDEAPWARLER